MDNIFVWFLIQLMAHAPTLFVNLVGIVFALMYWRQCPRPALFTLLGFGLLLVTTLVQTFLPLYLVQARRDFGWDHFRVRTFLSAINPIADFIRAGAFGLVLTAVFIDRKNRQQTDSGPERPPTESACGPIIEEHRITSRLGI